MRIRVHVTCGLCSRSDDSTGKTKQCNFLKQYGMSVYFEEVSKKLNICFEDLVKLVCLPEILKEDSVFGYSSKYKIKL